jgi:hypothetical protein
MRNPNAQKQQYGLPSHNHPASHTLVFLPGTLDYYFD